jgi:phosphatidylserine/phosphatidylglycerophosphate/cardiolipin synthase-like enzyme
MKQLVFLFLSFLSLKTLNAQTIKVYFNQSVDNTVSSITDAQTSAHLDDTICALINGSNTTLDIAVWDNGSSKIVTALNNAYARGVQVRYISSTNSLNTALSGLNSNIPLLKRTSTLTSNVMHNKFIIADNARLLIGSMNFGNGSIFDDYNNIVIITNTSLAQNYTTEFNEMWGSTGAQPNTTNSKFGPAKSDNTIHNFNIGGSTVESYFSPTDATSTKIVNAINSANFSLDVAMFTFTDNDLGDAVVAAKNRGVNVRCIIENVSYFGSEYTKLVNAGIPVISHENITNDFHHKYCIIDAVNTSSDPIVVTGSHNWSNSANDEYDENTLLIHDAIAGSKGDFINGTRLVYPMEGEAMRFLNYLGNHFFSWVFTWLLDQRFKDTLCGTKVMFREDYIKLTKNRKYFGEFDPFGDFDLLFGAHKLNLKIVEIPIKYRDRTYGSTNISRFKHGIILLRMCAFASRKCKFI